MPSSKYARRKHTSFSESVEPERGRSRTPKPMITGLEVFQTHESYRPLPRTNFPIAGRKAQNSRPSYPSQTTRSPLEGKGKSPDHSEPGGPNDATHEAPARGDPHQCFKWALEMQGIHLDWKNPRLDTVPEGELCFSEQTGMEPDATSEQPRQAGEYWDLLRAEAEQSPRIRESTATPVQRTFGRYEEIHDPEQRQRQCRIELRRAPRGEQGVLDTMQPQQLSQRPLKANPPSVLSHSLTSTPGVPHVAPRAGHTRPTALFPIDEGELSSVRTMWLEQGRKGYTVMEALVQPYVEPQANPKEPVSLSEKTPTLPKCESSEGITPSISASTSLSPAPSPLFSSVVTTTSMTTSISPETKPSLRIPSLPVKVTPTRSVTPTVTQYKPSPVPKAECPLHTHAATVSIGESTEVGSHKEFEAQSPERTVRRHSRTLSSESWFSRGGKTIGGLVDFVGRLPTAYLPVSERDTCRHRTTSCPPSMHCSQLIPFDSPSETFIYLLPLRPPLHQLTFPALPVLPRSPYRPITPPPRPTPRARFVPNPLYLRLKALQNRVLWGLVPVLRTECDFLVDVSRRHRTDAYPGRVDVDRFGQVFTAREALLRFAVEGAGRSALSDERGIIRPVIAPDDGCTWWQRFRL